MGLRSLNQLRSLWRARPRRKLIAAGEKCVGMEEMVDESRYRAGCGRACGDRRTMEAQSWRAYAVRCGCDGRMHGGGCCSGAADERAQGAGCEPCGDELA